MKYHVASQGGKSMGSMKTGSMNRIGSGISARSATAIAALALALVPLHAATPAFAAPQTFDAKPAAANLAIPAARDVQYPGIISLKVDASDVTRGIFRVEQTIPVAKAGRLTLLYPKWLPGNHAPRGPIDSLAGLAFTANGKKLTWIRDSAEIYAFHVEIPKGVTEIKAEFQYLSPTAGAQGRIVAAPEMLNLQWNATLLYPAGHYASRIAFKPEVTLPAGWSIATALDGAVKDGDVTRYGVTDLETLVDSPAFAGLNYRRIDLDPGAKIPFALHLFGDKAAHIAATDSQIDAHKRLVQQAYTVFGPGHFDHYDFLLAMSERMGGIGLEHHRSSENARGEGYFTEWDKTPAGRDLLGHEFTHSWDGKWRRPSDLWTAEYSTPMRDSLLWVYEGQTQFWGQVLTARAGLWTKEQALDSLANTAALYDLRPGRAWRPVADTTNDPIISARRPQPWRSWQRGEDYYSEGLLVWLDADQLIREKTNNAKSLDDFAKSFFGGGKPGDRTPALYDFATVVSHLNKVVPHDWARFLNERISETAPRAPLDGLTRGGWRLVYSESENELSKATAARGRFADFLYSLGVTIGTGNLLTEVMWDSPAFREGLTVGTEILAVNGRAFKADDLKEAVTAAKGTDSAIELITRKDDRLRVVSIRYNGGLRYPKLERIEGTPDRLGELLKPR